MNKTCYGVVNGWDFFSRAFSVVANISKIVCMPNQHESILFWNLIERYFVDFSHKLEIMHVKRLWFVCTFQWKLQSMTFFIKDIQLKAHIIPPGNLNKLLQLKSFKIKTKLYVLYNIWMICKISINILLYFFFFDHKNYPIMNHLKSQSQMTKIKYAKWNSPNSDGTNCKKVDIDSFTVQIQH